MAQARRKLTMVDPAVFCIRVQGELDKSWFDQTASGTLFTADFECIKKAF